MSNAVASIWQKPKDMGVVLQLHEGVSGAVASEQIMAEVKQRLTRVLGSFEGRLCRPAVKGEPGHRVYSTLYFDQPTVIDTLMTSSGREALFSTQLLNRETFADRKRFDLIWLNEHDKTKANDSWNRVEVTGISHWGLVATSLGLGVRVDVGSHITSASLLGGTPDTTTFHKVHGIPEGANRSQLAAALEKVEWDATPIKPGTDADGWFWFVRSLTPPSMTSYTVDGVILRISATARPERGPQSPKKAKTSTDPKTRVSDAITTPANSGLLSSTAANGSPSSNYVTRKELEEVLNRQQSELKEHEKSNSNKMQMLRTELKNDLNFSVQKMTASLVASMSDMLQRNQDETKALMASFTSVKAADESMPSSSVAQNSPSPKTRSSDGKRTREPTPPGGSVSPKSTVNKKTSKKH
ncbi:hypothetical protein DIPPA_32986 [Diplonema papillatum]|nr:hypothetical protein DIPPA_32986 [Diplonema papillatum]